MLRLHDLTGKSLWVDEANGVVIAGLPLRQLVERLTLDSSPPLHYLTLHVWMALFGGSEAAVRALSVLGGVVAIAVTFHVGRRLFTAETGALAAALVAASPLAVFHAQQARMYAWLPVASLLSFLFLWRAIDSRRATAIGGWVATTLAALYLHNSALYILPAHVAMLVATGAFRRDRARWALALGCVAVGYAPWVPVLVVQLRNRESYAWFRAFWANLGPLGTLGMTVSAFAPTLPSIFYRFATGRAGGWWAPLAMLAVAAVALVPALATDGGERRRRVRGLLACVVLPLAAALLASALLTPNAVPGRTDQVVFLHYLLLVAVGLTALRPVTLRYAVAAVLVLAAGPPLAAYYGNDWARGDRALAAAIAREARPGDAVVCTSLTCATLEYYLPRLGVRARLLSYPTDAALHLGNLDEAALQASPDRLRNEARRVREQIAETSGPAGRVFLVLVPVAYNGPLVNALATELPAKLGDYRQAGTGAPVQLWLLRP